MCTMITSLLYLSKFGKMTNQVSRHMVTNIVTPLPANQRPLILLDVDGVIVHSYSMVQNKKQDKAIRKEYKNAEIPFDDLTDIEGYLHSPTVVQSINKWSTVAEMIWLTSWKEKARKKLAPMLGIVDFPFSPLAVIDKYDRPDKSATVVSHIAECHPDRLIIWVDDEIGFFKEGAIKNQDKGNMESNQSAIEVSKLYSRPNTMLVSPFNGLCPKHVDGINEILAKPELAREKPIEMFYPGEQYFLRG